jgi:TM2 domain-containing membrane protein YozV
MLSAGVAYLLWLPGLLGICGLHRFYAGKPISGLIWLFTVGLLGLGQLIDLFLIPSMIATANARNSPKVIYVERGR